MWCNYYSCQYSSASLYFIAKEYTDPQGTVFRKNECYVRRGDRIELAGPEDFNRMYSKRDEKREKRLVFLEEKLLSKEKHREPKLNLEFVDHENNPIGKEAQIQIEYPSESRIKGIVRKINTFISEYLGAQEKISKISSSLIDWLITPYKKLDYKKYANALQDYYLDVLNKILLSSRTIKISLALRNIGNVSVSDILIFVEFLFCKVYQNENFLKFKMKPSPSKIDFEPTRIISLRKIPESPSKEEVKITQKKDKAIITLKLEKLLHKTRYTFPTFFAVIPIDQNVLEIDYSIHAENLAKSIKDKLYLYTDIEAKENEALMELPANLQKDLQEYLKF